MLKTIAHRSNNTLNWCWTLKNSIFKADPPEIQIKKVLGKKDETHEQQDRANMQTDVRLSNVFGITSCHYPKHMYVQSKQEKTPFTLACVLCYVLLHFFFVRLQDVLTMSEFHPNTLCIFRIIIFVALSIRLFWMKSIWLCSYIPCFVSSCFDDICIALNATQWKQKVNKDGFRNKWKVKNRKSTMNK